jgi:hypothetical protein
MDGANYANAVSISVVLNVMNITQWHLASVGASTVMSPQPVLNIGMECLPHHIT